jgi:hypothetical protein
MLVIPHRFKKIGIHNVLVRRIFSDILLVLELKKVEKHWGTHYTKFHIPIERRPKEQTIWDPGRNRSE